MVTCRTCKLAVCNIAYHLQHTHPPCDRCGRFSGTHNIKCHFCNRFVCDIKSHIDSLHPACKECGGRSPHENCGICQAVVCDLKAHLDAKHASCTVCNKHVCACVKVAFMPALTAAPTIAPSNKRKFITIKCAEHRDLKSTLSEMTNCGCRRVPIHG